MKYLFWHQGRNRWQIALFLAFLILMAPTFYKLALNNLVWLSVSWRILDTESLAITSAKAALAPQIAQASMSHARISMGLGVLSALHDDESSALALWQQGKDSEQLVAFGQRARANGLLNLAMLYFRGSGDLPQEQGWFEMGAICQRTLLQPERLSSIYQAFCRDLFQRQSNNLLLNSDFDTGTLDGWVQQGRRIGATMVAPVGVSEPALMIVSEGQSDWQSVYQWLNLPVGTVVRFSANILSDEERAFDMRLLYIGFVKPDGSAAGNSLAEAGIELVPHQWTHVERIYTIPQARNQQFLFAPAQLQGFGQLRVDQVRLEILEQP